MGILKGVFSMSKRPHKINPVSVIRLNQLKKEYGVTQKEIGERAGIGKTTINEIMTEKRPLTHQTAKLISQAFPKFSTAYLLGETDLKNSIDPFIESEALILNLIKYIASTKGFSVVQVDSTATPSPLCNFLQITNRNQDVEVVESDIAFRIRRYAEFEVLSLLEGVKHNGKEE